MSQPAQVWNNVTPVQYEALATEARAKGIPIAGNSGQAQKAGIVVMWSYVPNEITPDGALTIQVMKTPFFISEKTVAKDIAELVDAVLT